VLVGVVAGSYLLGAVPMSNIVAARTAGLDLRTVGSGTVSPWNLYRAAGPWPAALAGAFEVAKGVCGPLICGPGRIWWAAAAGALAVVGHNWSPLLRGAGGRGLSTATGALFVVAWPGAVVMCAGLLAGLLMRRVIRAMGVALCLVVPVLLLTGGPAPVLAAIIVVAPIGAKTAWLKFRQRLRSGRASRRHGRGRAAPESTSAD
jgi:acyl phosphate:glycerol-3-phosphate acyltransferase